MAQNLVKFIISCDFLLNRIIYVTNVNSCIINGNHSLNLDCLKRDKMKQHQCIHSLERRLILGLDSRRPHIIAIGLSLWGAAMSRLKRETTMGSHASG